MSTFIRDGSAGPVRKSSFYYAVIAGLFVAFVIAMIWYFLDTRERKHIESVTVSTAHGVEALIKKDIHDRVTSLSGIAHRWEQPGGLKRTDWDAAVKNIFQTQPGYEAIAWVDGSLVVRWVLLDDGREPVPNIDLQSRPLSISAIRVAQEKGVVVFTPPGDSVNGGKSISGYIPVFRIDASGKTQDGFASSVLLIESVLESLMPSGLIAEQDIIVSINGQQLFSTSSEPAGKHQKWVQRRTFELYDLTWQLDVVPKPEFLLNAYAIFSAVMLSLLVLLSSLAALTMYFVLSARWQAKQVRYTAHRLERLFKNLPGMSYQCLNRDSWPMVFVSDGCKRLCGYDRNELVSQSVSWGELIHLADRDRVRLQVANAIAQSRHFNLEYRIQTSNGLERWMWERGAEIPENGKQEAMLEGFITDVTDRKSIELALVRERAYSESIVATAIEAVITVSGSGYIETFNPAAEKMFGYSIGEIKGNDFALLLSKPYQSECLKYLYKNKLSIEKQPSNKTPQISCKRSNGSDFPVQISVGEMHHQTDKKFVCLIRDVSEQNLAELEARENREKLAHVERLNTLGEMATGIAHEINQPLTAISLFAQAGKRLLSAGKQNKLPDVFDKLSQHAQRAGAIIERVQLMTRQHTSTRKLVECNALITEVASLAEADAGIRDIIIELKLAQYLPPVWVDSVQIQQVTLNLLRNGMQSMQAIACKHGDTITLETRIVDQDRVQVSVKDSGSGVPASAAEKMFAPFSTTKESGMGMGLSISQSIILAHEGQLKYHNNDSGGATFSFSLPTAETGGQHV